MFSFFMLPCGCSLPGIFVLLCLVGPVWHCEQLVEEKASDCFAFHWPVTFQGHLSPIATDKVLFFIRKMLISFLFLDENICCGTH